MAILWDFFSVFPANAGMIPFPAPCSAVFACVPRECGDDPNCQVNKTLKSMCSPRMRG